MRILLRALILLFLPASPLVPGVQGVTDPQDPPVVFLDVNVVPMNHESVLEMQTVVIDGDRIVEMGPADTVVVPPNARVIDGTGRFLMPGLADMHVHFDDLAQAPIYLSYGITTVLNMRGDPRHLDWKRQFATGRLYSPHIYTAGRYINEPRFRTEEHVRNEVMRQSAAGYDIIKPHGELAADAYVSLNSTAREESIPVMGHAPRWLGLMAALENGQSLAHAEEFIYSWFGGGGSRWASYSGWLTIGTIVLLVVVLVLPSRSPLSSGVRRSALILLPVYLVFLSTLGAAIPNTGISVRIGSRLFLWLMTFAGLAALLLSAVCIRRVLLLRRKDDSPVSATHGVLAAFVSLTLVLSVLYWTPVAWRGSPGGIEKLAQRVHESGIYVTPNLVAYEAIGIQVGPDHSELLSRQEMSYLSPAIRNAWSAPNNRYRERFGESDASMFQRNLEFLVQFTAALQRAGVPLLTGSDAMNPGAIPGLSLHQEILLLIEAGLSPYEALRTATVNASLFLDEDFGTIEPGKRADLLLLIGNPLEDPGYLMGRLGVMVSGRWHPVGELAARLDRLVDLYKREESLLSTIEEKGLDSALAFIDEEGKSRDGNPAFRESRLDQYGHELLEAGKLIDAIRIFDLNVRAYPGSSNAYDSLAGAFLQQEDIPEAIRNYEISLSLNPANDHASTKLHELGRR